MNKSENTKPIGWDWDHSYIHLPEKLYSKIRPTPVSNPQPVIINYTLASELGLDTSLENLSSLGQILSGNDVPEGANPIATAYIGHQFGYANMLGDGRAILLGEHLTPSGKRLDIQLKGSGITPYSRRGDGRATLASMLREHLISEAMHGLGIPTTRSLAVIASGDPVYREKPEEGAILTRIASSHIRVGTFEFASRNLSKEDFQKFLQYVIERHYPQLQGTVNPAIALLEAVMQKQAYLISEWMRVGFIHGVMNTDNISIAGETIDYGPCAFMNRYDPSTVFSSIDTSGRYAYANQPSIGQWNLAVFASTLLPLISETEDDAVELAKASIQEFSLMYAAEWKRVIREKLGLFGYQPDDRTLFDDLTNFMYKQRTDYTNTFYALSLGKLPEDPIFQEESFKHWFNRWQKRLQENEMPIEESYALMQKANPAFIPRNHQVESALEAAVLGKEFAPFHQMLTIGAKPYLYRGEYASYMEPPPTEAGYKTYCGT